MTMDGSRIIRGKDMYLFDAYDFKGDTKSLAEIKTLERRFYEDTLDRVIANPRFYLDKIDVLPVFMVSFHHYKAVKSEDL